MTKTLLLIVIVATISALAAHFAQRLVGGEVSAAITGGVAGGVAAVVVLGARKKA